MNFVLLTPSNSAACGWARIATTTHDASSQPTLKNGRVASRLQ
jgi:hypothetical protein